jgi:GWxTD domain-containing protein
MTPFLHWVQTPVARALGWTLFHFLWEGIAIAAALALLLLFVRPARARYAAACVALAAMLGAFGFTFARVLPEQAPGPVHGQLRLPPPPDPTSGSPTPHVRFQASDLLPWIVPVWLAGVLLLHFRTLAGWMAARRLRRSGVCLAPSAWQERLTGLARAVRLAMPVALLESCRVDVPLVVGYLRPAILVPLGMLSAMPTDHVEAILLHELAHIRRRDYLVNLLQAVAENLLFYHPAVWWISSVIRTERENCCDDLVVAVRGNAHDYAIALTALEESRWTGEPVLAATGGNLMKRIHRLLNRPERPHAALTPAFSAGLVIVLAAVAMAAWQPSPDPRPQEPARKQDHVRKPRRGPAELAASAYEKWLNEDVAYIVTDQERTAFQQLTTNDEREHFIEQFWLRRDPTPGTVENEFKEEHYRRIAYSNERFATPASLPGWKTDLGRIYITYGPPDEIEQHPSGGKSSPNPYIDWMYRHLDGIGDNIVIEFVDQNRTGDYRMTMDPHPTDASISRNAIWADTVRRGNMRRQVRGLGELGPTGAAEVRVAETQAKELVLGQLASVDLHVGVVSGRVARIDPTVVNGTVGVTIQLDAPPPTTSQPGQTLDAIIDIETLNDVIYVGRPVFGNPNSTGFLFKIEPDGQHAVKVPVVFGRVSVNQIQILNGLVPGDKVILSDMSAYSRFDRIQLK